MAVFAFYTAKGDFVDRAIRLFTWSRFSHVELVTDGPLRASNAVISASKRDGGVREKVIAWNPAHWVFVELPDSATVPPGPYIMTKYYAGRAYDTWGAVATVFRFARPHASKWFCSELMAHSLNFEDAERYTPGAFYVALMGMGGETVRPEAHKRI